MVVRRRKKNTRAHGHKTHFSGEGGKQNRGKGTKGGKGRAGHGKRAAHKKLMFIKEEKEKGFTYPLRREINTINVRELGRFLSKVENGVLDLAKLGYDKLLGKGIAPSLKGIKIRVKSYSEKAKEKIKNAGGELIEA